MTSSRGETLIVRLFVVLLTLSRPARGFAHAGHGDSPQGMMHYLVETEHVLPLTFLVAAGVVGWVLWVARRKADRR